MIVVLTKSILNMMSQNLQTKGNIFNEAFYQFADKIFDSPFSLINDILVT